MPIHHKARAGFTLVELMIVTAIIAILASVAVPSYLENIRKGRRSEARAHLTNLLQQQERFQTQRSTYMAFPQANNPAATAPFTNYIGANYAGSSHVFGARLCQAVNGTVPTIRDCVEVFGVPNAGFDDAGVTMLAIDTMGRRRCTGTLTERCWK